MLGEKLTKVPSQIYYSMAQSASVFVVLLDFFMASQIAMFSSSLTSGSGGLQGASGWHTVPLFACRVSEDFHEEKAGRDGKEEGTI